MKARWPNILAMLMLPACLAALAPFLASWHWTIDLLACFPVQALGTLILGIIALAFMRKWLISIGLLPFAAIALAAILPGWTRSNNFPENGDNTPRLRVLSLNLLHSNEKGQQLARKVIRDLSPDVIWCSEYTPRWQRFLQKELPDFPYRCEKAQAGPFGAALFSRHPLLLKEMIPLGLQGTPGCRVVIQTLAGPIGLLGIHPPPPGLSKARSENRDRGLAAIPEALRNLPERRIVCGDFNATPWNPSFQELRATTGLSPGTTTSWLPTWPTILPMPLRIPIDHILVGGKLTVEEAMLGANFYSDHLPLFAVIAIVE